MFLIALALLIAVGLIGLFHKTAQKSLGVIAQRPPTRVTYQGLVIPKNGSVLLPTISGTGSRQTAPFSTSKPWALYWSFSTVHETDQAFLTIAVYNGNGQKVTSDKPLNLTNQESGYGTIHYESIGRQYLLINAPPSLAWSITIKTF